MGKLRHIALSVPDPWKAAAFFQKAFGMKKVGETDSVLARGVYLTDGTVNMALLNYKSDEMAGHRGKDFVGIHHLGFWVDDVDQSRQNIEASGGKYWMGEVPRNGTDNLFYEVKFHDPNGVVVDISANGWGGATKDVVPVAKAKAKAAPKAKLRAAAHARTPVRIAGKRRTTVKAGKAKRRKAG